MSQTETISERVRRWAEDGQLYLVAGVLSALVAWLLLPIVGVVGVYSGYRLYTETDRTRTAAGIVLTSLVALVLPFVIVATS